MPNDGIINRYEISAKILIIPKKSFLRKKRKISLSSYENIIGSIQGQS